METRMKVVEMPIEDITPYDNNPRLNDDAVEAVADSIRNYGFRQPIVVDRNNVIIVGHTRRLAAMRLGLKTVPVQVADDLTPEQVKAYRIADNKTAELSTWDYDALGQEVEELKEAGYDLSTLAFDETELQRLLEQKDDDADKADIEGETEPDDAPEPDENPDAVYASRRGVKYRLGDHMLVCGDCTEGADIHLLLEGDGEEPVSLWLSDPPYNINYAGRAGVAVNGKYSKATRNKDMVISNDNLGDEEFQSLIDRAFQNCAAYMPKGASFYLFHSSNISHVLRKALLENDMNISSMIIWSKNHFALGWGHYLQKHEHCWYGWKNGAASKWNGAHDASTTTIQQWNIIQSASDHPTPKPVDMLKFFIRNSSDRNDIVLDTFGGSGSTLIACEQTGRVCRMMELEPRYCDVIRRRWAEFVHGKGCDWQALTPEIDGKHTTEGEENA